MNPTFRPALTKAELHEIGKRQHGNEDIRTLLWEIARHRAQRLRDFQLRGLLQASGGGSMKAVRDAHFADLFAEPCVIEPESAFYGAEEARRRLQLELAQLQA